MCDSCAHNIGTTIGFPNTMFLDRCARFNQLSVIKVFPLFPEEAWKIRCFTTTSPASPSIAAVCRTCKAGPERATPPADAPAGLPPLAALHLSWRAPALCTVKLSLIDQSNCYGLPPPAPKPFNNIADHAAARSKNDSPCQSPGGRACCHPRLLA